MGTRTVPILIIFLLVTFARNVQPTESNNGDNRCLTLDRHGNCSCCKSGFRGQTCNDSCEHCLTRHNTEQSCEYNCESGYYGKTCDKPCPTTCASSISGPHLCKEKYGLPFCAKCIPGFYGEKCDQVCEANCLNRTCYKIGGKCLSCRGNAFYGDHCKLPCSEWCVSGECNMAGHCTHGCEYGFYGDRCIYQCGSGCNLKKCTSHVYHSYNCTAGCYRRFWGTSCLQTCPNHCIKCEQKSGRCTSCVKNYVQKPETGECEYVKENEEGKPAVPDVDNLAIFVIVVFIVVLVIAVLILTSIIVDFLFKRRHRSAGNGERGFLMAQMDNPGR